MILDSVPEPQAHFVEEIDPITLLLIDDDREQCEVLAHRLNRQGFEVVMAHTGRNGLQAAREVKPDAIVLDVRLPDADGLDLCQTLTDDNTTGCIPVIIVSGCERPNIVRQARQSGCRYYVRKPYDPNALLLLIEDTLRGEFV